MTEKEICTVLHCKDTVYAKGFCSKHYRMERRTGKPYSQDEKDLVSTVLEQPDPMSALNELAQLMGITT